MKLSEKIKTMVKMWEGCRLTAYLCPSGVPTVGYGHTGPDVVVGQRITQAKADELFDRDFTRHAASVEKLFEGTRLKPCQFDALASLSYNIGSLSVKAPTLVAKVKANPDDPSIRAEFARHVNGRVNGVLKPLPGLVRRRTAEANHYFSRV